MLDEIGRTDPVLEAIAELRDAFDLLIDEEKARWALHPVEAPTAEDPAAPPAEPRVDWGGRPEVREALNDPKTKRRPKIQVHPAERAAVPAPAGLAPASAEPARPAGAAGADDPRQRLDVLAKHLDRRARQSRPATPEPERRQAEAAER